MSNEFEDIDERLSKADPAERYDATQLPTELLQRATQVKHKASKRVLALSGAGALVAASVVTALVLAAPTPLINLAGLSGVGAQGLRADEGKMAADSMAPIFENFEYYAGPDLSDASGSGHIFEVRAADNAKAVVGKLASQLGVSGSVESFDYGTGTPAISIGDMAKRFVSMDQNSGNWYYSDSSVYAVYNCSAEPVDPGRDDKDAPDVAPGSICGGEAPPAAEPGALPTKSEAIAALKPLLQISEQNASDYRFNFESGDWGASLTATYLIDGESTPVAWNASWVQTGELASISGFAGTIIDRGSFDTISAKSAIDRMKDWRWFGSPAPDVYAEFPASMMRDLGQTDGDTTGDDSVASGSGDADSSSSSPGAVGGSDPDATEGPEDGATKPAPMPMPVQPGSAEVQRIQITTAKQVLATIWDANGRQWLVPAYVMVTENGVAGVVLAVKDGVIQLPEKDPNGEIRPMLGVD